MGKEQVKIKAWRLRQDNLSGSKFQNYVYVDERVARAKAESMAEEWQTYSVHEVVVRILSKQEGAVGNELVQIRHDTYTDYLKECGLRKLTKEERKALGV